MMGNSAFGSTSTPVNLRDATTSGFQLGGNWYYRDPAAQAWLYNGGSYTFSGWQQATGVGATDQAQAAMPTQPQVFVRRNQYEVGRANVIIYNWSGQATVPVDLSRVGLATSDAFEVRNVQDLFGGSVVSGVYDGSPVNFPITPVTAGEPRGGGARAPPPPGAALAPSCGP